MRNVIKWIYKGGVKKSELYGLFLAGFGLGVVVGLFF